MIAASNASETTMAARSLRPQAPRRELHDQIAFAGFVIAIFMGTTRLGPVTVPVWLALLPVLLWRFPPRAPWRSHLHPGLWFVLVPLVMVPLQAAAGYP